MPAKLGQVVSRQPSPDRVGQVRQAITRGVDYAGNFLAQGRAPEIGGAVRSMVEPVAQFPVTAVTDPLRAANQAQQALDPAYAMARGLTTTRLGAEQGNLGDVAAGVTEMGLAGLSFVPGGAAVKGARSMPPAPVRRPPPIGQPNVLAPPASRGPILNQLAPEAAPVAPAKAKTKRSIMDETDAFSAKRIPKPVQKAQAAGYEGQDIGEAKEWVAARSKGLDMSQRARTQRAKEQGFTINAYHGTAEDVAQFSENPPMRFSAGQEGAIFFADKPDLAASYASYKDRRLTPQLMEAKAKGESTIMGVPRTAEEMASRYQEGGNVMPVKLRMQQPLVVDAKGKNWSEVWGDALNRAQAQGADGVIMKNVRDWGDAEAALETKNAPRTVYALFDPSNIRSINAAFDPASKESANILATPPELGGAFVGGALGGTQGETPEERARNALLGAAGGAIGGRLASRAAIDRTRMGSNLGNLPKPIQKAQAQGYEGADIGEAQEWVSARSKGLDMSQPARMQRAQEMGFNTERVLYHGTPRFLASEMGDIKEFDRLWTTKNTKGRKPNIDILGTWVSDTPGEGGAGMYTGSEGAIYPLVTRARRIFKTTWEGLLENSAFSDPEFKGTANALANPEGLRNWLIENRYDAIQIEKEPGEFSRQNVFVILDPSNIRSVNAAFDPASKESANILAGVGAVGAGAAMMPRDQKKPPGQRPRG
jgi:hypothetical protein